MGYEQRNSIMFRVASLIGDVAEDVAETLDGVSVEGTPLLVVSPQFRRNPRLLVDCSNLPPISEQWWEETEIFLSGLRNNVLGSRVLIPSHLDLGVSNVGVSAGGVPVVTDFEWTGLAPAGFDEAFVSVYTMGDVSLFDSSLLALVGSCWPGIFLTGRPVLSHVPVSDAQWDSVDWIVRVCVWLREELTCRGFTLPELPEKR